MLEKVLSTLFIVNFLASTIRVAAPILFLVLGEIYAEKSGVLNIALEAQMLTGALVGFIGAYYTHNNWLGLLIGIVGGSLISLLFAFLTVTLRADQIVVGITLNIFALGLTTFIYRVLFGVAIIPPHVEPMPEITLPVLSALPFVGPILFQQKALVYLAFLVVPIAYFVLSIGQLSRFTDNMAAGRGFIALAIVIFGQWNPYRAALAALIFGAADALQLSLQAVGLQIPSQFLLMLPYAVTVIAMIVVARRAIAPASLAQPYVKEG